MSQIAYLSASHVILSVIRVLADLRHVIFATQTSIRFQALIVQAGLPVFVHLGIS